jgi:hypothetical protein
VSADGRGHGIAWFVASVYGRTRESAACVVGLREARVVRKCAGSGERGSDQARQLDRVARSGFFERHRFPDC